MKCGNSQPEQGTLCWLETFQAGRNLPKDVEQSSLITHLTRLPEWIRQRQSTTLRLPQTLVAVDPSAKKETTCCGFSKKKPLISTNKLKSKDPLPHSKKHGLPKSPHSRHSGRGPVLTPDSTRASETLPSSNEPPLQGDSIRRRGFHLDP